MGGGEKDKEVDSVEKNKDEKNKDYKVAF